MKECRMMPKSNGCPSLIPMPRHWVLGKGSCLVPLEELRIHPDEIHSIPLRTSAEDMGLRLVPDSALSPHLAVVGAPEETVQAPHRPEGYGLRVSPHGIVLAGNDSRGLVWALGTLSQMLKQVSLPPCCVISDWPEYAIRYHHDDISRREISTQEDFLRIVRDLGALKLNHYTLYMEDLFELPGEPQFGCGRGALSVSEIREIVAEGERRQVEVFPTVSLLGHQESMLKLPAYHAFGAQVWQPSSSFDPSRPAVRRHILKILDTLCPLFPSKFFHMGFDETQGVPPDLFLEHANWCAERLVERGKIPLFWADMLYNHFGVDMLDRMHPALTPVAWDYCPHGGAARQALPALLLRRPGSWILAGYRTNRTFLHDPLCTIQEQWENWRNISDPSLVGGFGASHWVDDGDNLRDGVWHLIGMFAECAWSGADADPSTVETRFNVCCYRHCLPELVRLRMLLENGLALDPAEAWELYMMSAPGWVRLASLGKLPSATQASESLRLLGDARRWLSACRRHVRSHWAQLAPWGVAIDRMSAVFHGVLAAHEPNRRTCGMACTAIQKARKSFRSAWFSHNKPEGIEHALSTFDEQTRAWSELPRRVFRLESRWHPLDLGDAWNTLFKGVAGVPIGLTKIGDLPLRFASPAQTHAEIRCGETLSILLPDIPIRDLHLVATQAREADIPMPGMRLRLLQGDRLLYEEELMNIRHLCDWWAPLGEHMWAGGGLAYVDPMRVRWLLKPNLNYGLTIVSRFPWHAAPTADRLELTGLSKNPVQLFAITVEAAVR